MKNVLVQLLFSILLVTPCIGKSDSLLTSRVDSIIKNQRIIKLKLEAEIKSNKDFQEKYTFKESLFSNQLSILTTIFSAIVAISIFLVGYFIPKLNDEKHNMELKKLLLEFETIRDEIKQSREETAKVQAQNNYNNSKLMFYNCTDSNNKTGEVLWALRHVKDNFLRFNNADDTDIEFFIDRANYIVPQIDKEHNLREYADEINTLTSELSEIYNVEGIKEKLNNIKVIFNEIAWNKVELPANETT